ncbi:MAG TPA: DUF2306 domain-containing protein [Rhodobacteraceae bacterium]|nr:DUF2306 domain-containing protein [Paracoccaceae bacterium]
MSLTPLLEAGIIIQSHALSAIIAFLLGPIIFYGQKGTRMHKRLGKLWAFAMALAILSSAFIWQIKMVGPFSPIHILTVLGAWGLISGINHARMGRISQHQASMKALYFWALGAAGVFTFMPGRVMSRMFFPEYAMAGFYIILGGYLAILVAGKLRNARSQNLAKG